MKTVIAEDKTDLITSRYDLIFIESDGISKNALLYCIVAALIWYRVERCGLVDVLSTI